jgi:hypothetical protein
MTNNPFSTENLVPNWNVASEILKGDTPGHPFHGNQYEIASQVAGKNVSGSDNKNYVEGRNGVFRDNLNSEYNKIQRGDTLAAIKKHFSSLRLRTPQEIELTKGSPDESKVSCMHCGKKMTEPEPGKSTPDTGRVRVTWNPKTKDFVRNPDGSVQGEHYAEGWNSMMGKILDLGDKIQ